MTTDLPTESLTLAEANQVIRDLLSSRLNPHAVLPHHPEDSIDDNCIDTLDDQLAAA